MTKRKNKNITKRSADKSQPLKNLTAQEKATLLRDSLPGLVLARIMSSEPGFEELAYTYLNDMMTEVAPRDPLERMLVQQLAWCNQRVARLSMSLGTEKDYERIKLICEQLDRAMNSFRRGMLALREYRVPYRNVHVAQLNQAEQQNIVCANQNSPAEKQ